MNDTSSVSVAKFVAAGLAAVLVLNILLRVVFKLPAMPVTMGIAAGVAALLSVWFAKSLGRIPTQRERSVFLWCYGGIIALTGR